MSATIYAPTSTAPFGLLPSPHTQTAHPIRYGDGAAMPLALAGSVRGYAVYAVGTDQPSHSGWPGGRGCGPQFLAVSPGREPVPPARHVGGYTGTLAEVEAAIARELARPVADAAKAEAAAGRERVEAESRRLRAEALRRPARATLATLQAEVDDNQALRRQVREAAGESHAYPVQVVEGDAAPRLMGDSFHWETRGGTLVSHPSAYSRKGWSNLVYCGSTLTLEVGAGWLRSHLRDLRAVVGCRPLSLDDFGPASEDDRVSIPRAGGKVPCVYRSVRGAIVTGSVDPKRGVRWWDAGAVVQVLVTDATAGHRHAITVPPHFARPLGRRETRDDRVRAAIAWTFGLGRDQYAPAVEA
jgi:hypothetical protein